MTSLLPGEILFDIGSRAECFYYVRSGVLSVEAEVTIKEENKYPVDDYEWEIVTKTR